MDIGFTYPAHAFALFPEEDKFVERFPIENDVYHPFGQLWQFRLFTELTMFMELTAGILHEVLHKNNSPIP
jgi:hypothetical protein